MQKFSLPPAPIRARKESAPLVHIKQADQMEFDSLARGTFFAFAEREQVLAQLPRIDSSLARIPLPDAELKDKEGAIAVREQELKSIHDILLTTLNISEVRPNKCLSCF